MNLLSRNDLRFVYNWKSIPNEDPRISGTAGTTLFNRKEGFEILYLINSFAEKHGVDQKEKGLRIEKLIKEELPLNFRSQIHAIEWLEENIDKI
jgi:hypothetical protein